MSHALHKYVMNLLETESAWRNDCKWLELGSTLQLIIANTPSVKVFKVKTAFRSPLRPRLM